MCICCLRVETKKSCESIIMKFILVCCLLVVLVMDQVQADKCKKTLRTVFFERCRVRNRRSDGYDGFSSDMESTPHHHAAKRQIMSIREIFVASRVPIYRVPYPSYARHEYNVPAVPPQSAADVYRVQRPKPESLPVESHSEVGFEMSFEEMIELVDEIYERMPRGTKSREEMQKEFLPLFEECCKNVELCRTKKDVTQCPYN